MLHKSCLSGRLGAVGFTLIELLVVVLIIGILAAVALPQYQKAVKRSKIAQIVSFMRQVQVAEELFYTATGGYTNSWELLAIDPPASSNGWNIVLMPSNTQQIGASLDGLELHLYFLHATSYPTADARGKIYCAAETGTQAAKLCKTFGKEAVGGSADYVRYYL